MSLSLSPIDIDNSIRCGYYENAVCSIAIIIINSSVNFFAFYNYKMGKIFFSNIHLQLPDT